MSCYIIIDHTINRIYIFHTFALVFYFFIFLRLDLLSAATTSKAVIVLVPPLVRRHLAGRRTPLSEPTVPLTVVGADKTESSGFTCFEQELPALVHFACEYILATPLEN
jgi:hypothetical protein